MNATRTVLFHEAMRGGQTASLINFLTTAYYNGWLMLLGPVQFHVEPLFDGTL